jgi:acetoin utilization deacetylase AcuC-like enzyme
MTRHHATRVSAAGFCYVADAVLAILRLKRAPRRPRIMYIDLDLHHGDGVAGAFANKLRSRRVFPQILTLSIHHTAPGFYPAGPLADLTLEDTSDPFTLSVPLKAGASAATFAQIWVAVEKIRASFAPEHVVVQCGVDGLAGDPCAKWNWCIDRQIEGSLGWCVERILQWNCGTLLLGGGMYLHYLRSPKFARGVVLSRTSRGVRFSECGKSMELSDIYSSGCGIPFLLRASPLTALPERVSNIGRCAYSGARAVAAVRALLYHGCPCGEYV